MKITVDYYYKQYFLPTKRHRKERVREVKDHVSLNITEISKEDFPIAFIVHDMESVQKDMTCYEDYTEEKCDYCMFPEEIRTYKEKLYKPIRITHGTVISTIFEDEKFILRNIERLGQKQLYYSNDNEFSKKSIIVRDNKKLVKQSLRNGIKKYIYCDGKFWTPCNEPRYLINTFGLGHNHGGTGFFIEYHYNPNISSKNYFNALQRDEAIAYGKAVALGRGDTEYVDRIGIYRNIEVLIPEIVKVNPNKQHGNGNEFMNMMESVICNSSNKNEAGLLCLALAMSSN